MSENTVHVVTDSPAEPPRGFPPLDARALRSWNVHVVDAQRRLEGLSREAAKERERIATLRPDLAEAERVVLAAALDRQVAQALEPIRELEAVLEAQQRHLAPAGVRRNALLDSDPVRLQALHRLVSSAPDAELGELARAALDRRDLALGELVRREAARRGETLDRETAHAIAGAIDGLDASPIPAVREARGALADLRRAMLRTRALSEQAQHGHRRTFTADEIENMSFDEYKAARAAAGDELEIVDGGDPSAA